MTHVSAASGGMDACACACVYVCGVSREFPQASVRKGGLDLEGEVTLVHTKRKTAVTPLRPAPRLAPR